MLFCRFTALLKRRAACGLAATALGAIVVWGCQSSKTSFAQELTSSFAGSVEAFQPSPLDFSRVLQSLSGPRSQLPVSAFSVLMHGQRERMARIVATYCEKIDAQYKRYGWGKSPCLDLPWTYQRVSENGEPLIYWEYSNTDARTEEIGTTLVLGGVHPDEITPIHVAFRFANALRLFPENYSGHRVIIAPLVNPDGFLKAKPTRTNLNGVDLNRNFPTNDWWRQAHLHWQKRRNNDVRHNPGPAPRSEEGTRFQLDLLAQFVPDKIISIHAPLAFLDYDGPGDSRTKSEADYAKRARELVFSMSRNSHNYRVKEFPIYPGSLGNYSGNERAIPTVTLELDSTDPRKVNQFWREFYPGLKAAIKFDFRRRYLASLDPQCHSIFCAHIQIENQAPDAVE